MFVIIVLLEPSCIQTLLAVCFKREVEEREHSPPSSLFHPLGIMIEYHWKLNRPLA